MKTKLKNFLHSDLAIFLMAFAMGGLCHFAIYSNLMASDTKIASERSFLFHIMKDFNKDFEDKISQMHSHHQIDFTGMDLNRFMEGDLKENLKITMREDNNYKYVEIRAKDKDALKIDIKEGLVLIRSEVINSKKEETDNEKFYSTYASSIGKSFIIPDGVDENKAEVLKESDKIVIKFPKFKFNS